MPTVRAVLSLKDQPAVLHCVDPATSVLDAIRKMNHHKIGAVLVMHNGQVVGIFTERDVLRRVVGEERPAATTTVAEVMTEDVICVPPEADLDEVANIMKQRKVRHVPVCDEQAKVYGIISIGDVNAYHASNQQEQIHFLSEYIYGRV
jgi:CBS domain-containing protein